MAERKKYTVIVSDRAKYMLGAHLKFLAQVSKPAAAAEKKEIMTELRSLSQMPDRYPLFEGSFVPSNKYHRLFIKKRYLALYQVQGDTVYVDYILDCRQDYDWLIR